MLQKLVDRTCAGIDRIELGDALPALQPQIRENAPEAIADLMQLARTLGQKGGENEAVGAAAATVYVFIKGVPPLARRMIEAIGDRRIAPARRCAVAGILAYLVQPRDLIPDDAPGGYGFLDDTILLRAGLIEYLNTLPQAEIGIEHEGNIVGMLVNLAPAHVRPLLLQSVSTMSLAIQFMSMMEGPIAEMMLAQIVANPLQDNMPPAPQGYVPRSTPDYSRGHWSGGAYFEGNNVIFSGGPSLIDGQLFIP